MKPETDTILTEHRKASIAWGKAYDAIYNDPDFRGLDEDECVRRSDALSDAIAATEAIERQMVDLIEGDSLDPDDPESVAFGSVGNADGPL